MTIDIRSPLLERFLRYVQIGTSADPSSETYPSSSSQLVFTKLLYEELLDMGLLDCVLDEHGMVWATIPASSQEFADAPMVLLNSHVDTSPEAPGTNVKPHVIESFDGKPIKLGSSGVVIDPASCADMANLIGKTLVVTDGTTLLGGDDKAGVAVIMQLASLLTNKQEDERKIQHGPVRILFTCDEEIGQGTRHITLEKLAAHSLSDQSIAPLVGYTLDGGDQGQIDEETFSADMAIVRFKGSNIHPAIAKGRMINAVRAAAMFVDLLPTDRFSPESTEGREGFLHPYDLHAGVGEATVQLILRDFDEAKLHEYKLLLERIGEEVTLQMPGLQIDVETREQYRNMAAGIAKLPEAVLYAEEAYKALGVSCQRTIVRGGTDGSLLTAMGLPTPNLSVGQHNIHAVTEFACLDQMVIAVEHLMELLKCWAKHKSEGACQ
jgi:tripeptide aminopeptidase